MWRVLALATTLAGGLALVLAAGCAGSSSAKPTPHDRAASASQCATVLAAAETAAVAPIPAAGVQYILTHTDGYLTWAQEGCPGPNRTSEFNAVMATIRSGVFPTVSATIGRIGIVTREVTATPTP